jgi:hypothetical protein
MPETVERDAAEYRYAAFISYRHAERDGKMAKWLHTQI